jgi:hypothetical protein
MSVSKTTGNQEQKTKKQQCPFDNPHSTITKNKSAWGRNEQQQQQRTPKRESDGLSEGANSEGATKTGGIIRVENKAKRTNEREEEEKSSKGERGETQNTRKAALSCSSCTQKETSNVLWATN